MDNQESLHEGQDQDGWEVKLPTVQWSE